MDLTLQIPTSLCCIGLNGDLSHIYPPLPVLPIITVLIDSLGKKKKKAVSEANKPEYTTRDCSEGISNPEGNPVS